MKHFIAGILLVFVFGAVIAQPSLSRMQAKLQSNSALLNSIEFKLTSATQGSILFKNDFNLPETQARQWLEDQLEVRQGDDALRIDNNVANTRAIEVKKVHQYFKGIKVEHGVINLTSRNGRMAMMQLEFYPVKNGFNTVPMLSENAALQKALDFVNASKYEWADAGTAVNAPAAPRAELVIIKNYLVENEVCLAYKFEITSLLPVSSAYIYVNAWNGEILLNDPLIKHVDHKGSKLDKPDTSTVNFTANIVAAAPFNFTGLPAGNRPLAYSNSVGNAATKYNGIQSIYTDNASGISGFPYRLRETRNGMNIETYDFHTKPWNATPDQYPLATDFTDDDNDWTALEYDNPQLDNGALNVHFNMQVVSDYWFYVHNRKSLDNNYMPIKSYVHVNEYQDDGQIYSMVNAFWLKGRMNFGDGNFTPAFPVYTPLDVSAHETGHGITENTCNLVYQWESGALNEGFSDIWGACVTNYAKSIYPGISSDLTWRASDRCRGVGTNKVGSRDMADPLLFDDPNAFEGTNWIPASLPTCRNFGTTDNCGVHTNSGVLNKWFNLITAGGSGTNTFGTNYSVIGLGFTTTEKIAYLTELNLTPNATFATAKNVSLNATASLFGNPSNEFNAVKAAWLAVGVDSNIYNMGNTPAFETNNFTSVAVGKNGVVMAGTNYSGMYKYENDTWQKLSDITDVRINDIKADKKGNFWVAQSGRSGQQSGGSSIAGGVNYYESPFTAASTLYTIGAQTDVPSRNARCVYVDTFSLEGINPKVWMAGLSYITSSNSTSGMLGQGLYTTSPKFHNVNANINIASGTVGCLTVGGNKKEIWTFVQANNGTNQLLVYDASTYAFVQSFDHNTNAIIPSGFVARSIYGDSKNRVWVGLAAGGILVYDENKVWHYISSAGFPNAFPAGSQASFNAIAGTRQGDIYFGTTSGLVFFERGDGLISRIDQPASYRLFTKTNGLPSTVINAIAYDTLRFKLLLATDSGVVFWEPLCIGAYCQQYTTKDAETAETIQAGNWSNPATWTTGKVPDSTTIVIIQHNVTVDVFAACHSLSVRNPATIIVNTGKKLTIYQDEKNVIIDDNRRRQIRR